MPPDEPVLPEPELDEPPELLPEPDDSLVPPDPAVPLAPLDPLGPQSALDEPLLDAPPGGQSAFEPEEPELLPEPDDPAAPESVAPLPLEPDEPLAPIELPELPLLPLPVPVEDDWAKARPATASSATSKAEDDLRIFPPKKGKAEKDKRAGVGRKIHTTGCGRQLPSADMCMCADICASMCVNWEYVVKNAFLYAV